MHIDITKFSEAKILGQNCKAIIAMPRSIIASLPGMYPQTRYELIYIYRGQPKYMSLSPEDFKNWDNTYYMHATVFKFGTVYTLESKKNLSKL